MTLVWLVACGTSGLQQRPDVYDTGDVEEAPVAISRLDPDWGNPDDETVVTIEGRGFEGAVVVGFGRAEVVATVLDEETLVVTAPAAGVESSVDVTVTSSLGEATAPGAFTWAYDEPADTGDPGDTDDTGDTGGDSGGDTSGAGKVGGLVQYQLVQIACPDCLGYTSAIQVAATAGFHAPTNKSWLSWLPSKGTCVDTPVTEAAASNFLDAGSLMRFEYGADDDVRTTVTLRPDTGVYVADGLAAEDYVRTAGWRVEAPGGADLPEMQVENAFYTPDSITSLEPVEMLYTDIREAFAARVSKSRADFSWSPYGSSDAFAVVIDVYKSDGSAYLGQVFCLDGDTGSMRVPSGYLSGYPSNSLLVIGMHRYATGGFLRPDNASTVEGLAVFGVLGTGILTN